MKAQSKKSRLTRIARASKPAIKPEPASNASSKRGFYVVGIGTSAGGLEALEGFFRHMPADPGLAFVLVPHLDPTHKPLLTGLLQRSTQMKVCEIDDRTKVRRNRIYVIPPNKDLSIEHGVLHLKSVPSPRGLRMPIDFFLRRLAEDLEHRAIGVILSGMGSDGTLGLKAIKSKMGLAMAQEPTSAKYEGMPRSAIETGIVDFVAPPDQLATELVSYVRRAGTLPPKPRLLADKSISALQKIITLLREQTGHDFSFYKKNTICRRIERRMTVHNHPSIQRYVRFLEENPVEAKLLFNELLIGVTNFFRDAEAWEVLKGKALPQLLKDRTRGSTLRVWVPGCSSGEEVYTVAIVLREAIEEFKPKGLKVQIFATDIDRVAIDVARQGFFPENTVADVSPERLKEFFVKEEHGYRVNKQIREMMIFAPQNIIMDPPFTKLDLLCCRNLLIYFTPELQRKLLPLFYYALNPGGILMLGSSESIGSFVDRFQVIDNQWKIFSRKDSGPTFATRVELPSAFLSREGVKPREKFRPAKEAVGSLPDLAQRLILEHYAPAAVVVNADGDLVYISGHTGKYLEPSPGKANMNLLAMAREGLRLELSAALRKAAANRTEVSVHGVRIESNGGPTLIDLTVRPLLELESLRGLCLVVFEEVELPPQTLPTGRAGKSVTAGHGAQLAEIERELKHSRERLQTTIEEMETSQEELKSANEELQSTNEELQSTNEELTTSKEEMQSLNEELVTVNAELQAKVDELSQASNDMKNLLNSTEIATIFLDNHLNIKRFTPQFTRIINLIPADVGRPVEHLAANLKSDLLIKDSREVLLTLVSKETQVQTINGLWYVMRTMPYRTMDNVIDGVVITFSDITPVKRMEASLSESQHQMRAFLENMPVMLTATDANHAIVFWNHECERITGWKAEEVVGNPKDTELFYPDDGYREKLRADRDKPGSPFRNQEVRFTCKDGSVKTLVWFNIAAEYPIPGWAEWGVAWELEPGTGRVQRQGDPSTMTKK